MSIEPEVIRYLELNIYNTAWPLEISRVRCNASCENKIKSSDPYTLVFRRIYLDIYSITALQPLSRGGIHYNSFKG